MTNITPSDPSSIPSTSPSNNDAGQSTLQNGINTLRDSGGPRARLSRTDIKDILRLEGKIESPRTLLGADSASNKTRREAERPYVRPADRTRSSLQDQSQSMLIQGVQDYKGSVQVSVGDATIYSRETITPDILSSNDVDDTFLSNDQPSTSYGNSMDSDLGFPSS